MNLLFEKYKWLKFVLGGLIIVFGVVVIILAAVNTGEVGKVINIVVASGLFVLGGLILVTSLITETHKPITSALFLSSIIITFGVLVLLLRFHFHIDLTGLLVYLLAVFLLVFGTVALAKAVLLIIYKQKPVFIALMFILAVLGITAGILGLCFANKLVATSYILLGVILVAIGTVLVAIPAIKKK